MALQFRQGPESDRTSVTPAQGEPIWITDQKKLYIGDGTTAGGVAISGGGGGGLGTFTDIIVYNTATVDVLKFSNATASISNTAFNDITLDADDSAVRIVGDQGLIIGDGGGLSRIQVDSVQVMTDVNPLILQGPDINLTNFANTITYAVINGNGSTHYGNYHNFGNTNATAQINSQGTGNLVLSAGSDAGMTGGLTLSSGNNGNLQVFGPGSRPVSTFSTATILDVVQNRIDFDAQLLTYNDGTSQPVQIKSYNNGGAGIIETILPMRHRGTKVSPASIQQSDTLSRYQSMPYTDTWADSNVFGFLSGSYFDGYSYGPEYAHVVSQDFNDAPLYWNHIEGYHQWMSYNPYDPTVHSTSTEQVLYTLEQQGNKLTMLNGEIGGSFGGLDSTIKIVPTKADATEVTFTFNAATETFTAPAISVTNTATVGSLTATNTSTVGLLTIGKNNSRVTFPGQTTYANSMLIANDNTSGPIIFTTKGATTNRNLMISRTASLVFHEGAQISSQTNGGLNLSAMSTSTAATMSLSAVGGNFLSVGQLIGINLVTASTTTQWTTNMNTSTGGWSFPTNISVTNTATAQSIVSTTTTVTGMMTLPVYTKTALTAITGSVGQIAIVSDSAGGSNPNGMMAFWDTTNSRWSYVHDNNAV